MDLTSPFFYEANMIKINRKEENTLKIKWLISIIVIAFSIFISSPKAAEAFYINNQGISFTQEEYEFITKIYWDGYQEKMNYDDYEMVFGNGMPIDVEIEEYTPIMTFSDAYSTASKSIKITKSNMGSYKLITISVDWMINPIVRSYDVIGAYLTGVKLVNGSVKTRAFSDSEETASTDIKQDANGFGVSIKLPTSGNNFKIAQTFRVTRTGTIYASYQHAVKNISLANSKKYSISKNGYGSVFAFNNSIKSYYDGMQGVDIAI